MVLNGIQISKRNVAPNSVGLKSGCPAVLTEDGVVIEIFAICLGLLAVLAFGLALQMPTNQASALRGHHALQAASAGAILSINDQDAAAEAAWNTAAAIISNGYVAESGAVPTGRFSTDLSNFYVLIPNRLDRANDTSSDSYFVYGCNESSSPHCTLGPSGDLSKPIEIASRIFDTWVSHEYDVTNPTTEGTHDYKNGVMIYAEINPLAHSIYKDSSSQPIVSIAMTVPSDVYILVDPAMSMTPQIYNWVFGASEVGPGFPGQTPFNGSQQFPVVYDREAFGGPEYFPGPSWEYPAAVGLMHFGPRGEDDLAGPTNQRVRNFFASLCFNSPWDLYKGAVVDLIDYLQASSAYNRSLGVGLVAPLKSLRDLDPNFTAAAATGADRYNYSPVAHLGMTHFAGALGSDQAITTPTAYIGPLPGNQLNASGLESGNFQGMVRIFDPYDNDLANGNFNRLSAGNPAEGKNLWSTLICRALVTEDNLDGAPAYSLTDDRTSNFPVGSEPQGFAGDVFDFRNVDTRRRFAGAGLDRMWRKWTASWVSDASTSAVDIADGASGQPNHGVRNVVAGLAPSFNGLQETIKDVAGYTGSTGNWTNWSRNKSYKNDNLPCANNYPDSATPLSKSEVAPDNSCNNQETSASGSHISAPQPIADDDVSSPMVQDWRDIPSAMRAACEALAENKSDYMSNPFLATERPLGPSKLVVFAFGLYSPLTNYNLGLASADGSFDEDDRKDALRAALNFCSCTMNVEIIFDFLPLSPWDQMTVIEAAEVISDYQRMHDNQCKPMYFPPNPVPGCAQTKSIQFFVSQPSDFNSADALVQAAKDYRDNVRNLKLLFNKFVYKM